MAREINTPVGNGITGTSFLSERSAEIRERIEAGGIGLHVVYNLVTRTLGGKIAFRSPPGEGLRFTIEIPLPPDASSKNTC